MASRPLVVSPFRSPATSPGWPNAGLFIPPSQFTGYVQSFEYVFEDEDRTARLTFSGEGAVYPHLFGRNEIAIIAIVDIPYLHRKATEL